MSNKKRDRSVFKAIQELDQEDAIALTKRKASTKRQKQSSLAAISQQKLYTKMLEVRILLQRALQSVEESKNGGDDREEELLQCEALLANLLRARDTLFRSEDDNDEVKKPEDYLRILSDSDALDKKLEEDYQKYEKEWQTVLNQRHKDVRLHAGLTSKSQFRVLDSSFWEQVEQTVSHEKLMNRKDETVKSFDDSKVYQQLLKDFLSSSSVENQANHQLSSGERLLGSRKTVNEVDRRASKGRKIRYTPLPKLVNFTFPLSRPTPTNMLDEEAWFNSLFGGAGSSKRKSDIKTCNSENSHSALS